MTIFYDIVDAAAIAAGTARSQLDATYRVPSAARELLGFYLQIINTAPSAGEPFAVVFDIIGTDYRYQPCEALFPVGHGVLAEITGQGKSPSEFWPVHAPLNGTEILDIGATPGHTLAGGGYGAVTMAYSTVRTGKPTIFGRFETSASGTTAASTTALTAITLSNAHRMYEAVGAALDDTAAADQPTLDAFTFTCTQWDPIQTIKFMTEGADGAGGASFTTWGNKIVRLPFDARFKATQATIEGTAYNILAHTAGINAYGVRYY